MIEIIIASLAIMLASLAGVFSIWKQAGALVEKNLDYLVSFSAGVFLVVIYGLSQEAIEHLDLAQGLFWIFFGALFVWVVSKLLPTLHAHRDHAIEGEHKALDARRVLIGDGVHNIGDGILLAASFGVSPILGITAAVSIFVHELLQEVSEFFILRDAGFAPKRALTLNFLVSSTILIGSIGGFFLLDVFEVVEGPLLGISAGAFLIVVLHDLIPHSIREARSPKHSLKHLMWFLIGATLMFGVSVLVPHEEPEVHEDEHIEILPQ